MKLCQGKQASKVAVAAGWLADRLAAPGDTNQIQKARPTGTTLLPLIRYVIAMNRLIITIDDGKRNEMTNNTINFPTTYS